MMSTQPNVLKVVWHSVVFKKQAKMLQKFINIHTNYHNRAVLQESSIDSCVLKSYKLGFHHGPLRAQRIILLQIVHL